MYIYIYVCVCVCVCVCVTVCVYVIYVYMHVCFQCMCLYLCVHFHVLFQFLSSFLSKPYNHWHCQIHTRNTFAFRFIVKRMFCCILPQVLLGALSLSDRHAMLSSGRPTMGGHEQHNVLALTSCSARFPLLPLGSQPSRSSLQQMVVSQAINRVSTCSVIVIPFSNHLVAAVCSRC